MKKRTKKVVIATSASIAGMVLTAACGYGPPPSYEDVDTYSTYEESVAAEAPSVENATDETSEPTEHFDELPEDVQEMMHDFERGPVAYGPPPSK